MKSAFAIVLIALTCACVGKSPSGLRLAVELSSADDCTVIIDGQRYALTADQPGLEQVLKAYAQKKPLLRVPVTINGNIDTPYRCIGGVTYTLQLLGFQRVHFSSSPP